VAKEKREGMMRKEFLLNTAMAAGIVASFGTGAVYAYKFVVPERRPQRLHKVYICPLQSLPPFIFSLEKEIWMISFPNGRKKRRKEG